MRENYIQPLLSRIIKEMSPLCKAASELTERFELMVCGKEVPMPTLN
jgi:lysyl-tRNA synthetase class II